MSEFWEPGAHVVRRGIAYGAVWIVHTMLVVSDAPEQTVLLLVPGAPCKVSSGLVQRKYSGRENNNASRWDEQENPPWQLVDWEWQHRRLLVFMEPGAYYAINMVWKHECDRFLGWYVNFETPFRRTPIGFDTLDLELDLEVRPDYSLHWKDVVEYEEGLRRGAISATLARQIERAKKEVVRRIKRRDEPFDGNWNNWLPEGNWGVPELHMKWNDVESVF
ncbi:MAG: DUF402 domain-containing protein [Chloroflexota bacterium]